MNLNIKTGSHAMTLTPDQIAALERHMTEPHYTDAQIAQAERLLQSAFRTLAQGSHSTSEIFSGAYRSDNKKFRESRVPAYLIDENHKGERRDHWATRTHATASGSAKFSRPAIEQLDYAHAAVHRVVNGLPERHLILIKSTYMPKGPQQKEFAARLLTVFWQRHQVNIAPGTDRAVQRAMAEIVVEIRGSDERHMAGMVRDWLQIARASWYKTYLPAWRHLVSEYRRAHRDAICAFLDAD